MKMTFFATLAAFLLLTLTGCGSNNSNPPPVFVTTSIFSDARFDGDISFNPISGFAVTQGNTLSVFAGLDPFIDLEYRAFLDFPLTGVNGVPGDAIIESAFLDIFINSIDIQFANDTIPLRIDLVSFQPPLLIGSDFNRPALATITVSPPISSADSGGHVIIDVTALMSQAQRLGHLDFQVRIMEDFEFVTPGVIEINETTLAPLLTVTYF
jgi:hypothetical protein